jgi:hypothetical protein
VVSDESALIVSAVLIYSSIVDGGVKRKLIQPILGGDVGVN